MKSFDEWKLNIREYPRDIENFRSCKTDPNKPICGWEESGRKLQFREVQFAVRYLQEPIPKDKKGPQLYLAISGQNATELK